MERMALDNSLEREPSSLYDSETLNRQQSIGGAGRSETTTGTKEERNRMLIEVDQDDHPFSNPLVGRSLFHKMKRPLSSFSAS